MSSATIAISHGPATRVAGWVANPRVKTGNSQIAQFRRASSRESLIGGKSIGSLCPLDRTATPEIAVAETLNRWRSERRDRPRTRPHCLQTTLEEPIANETKPPVRRMAVAGGAQVLLCRPPEPLPI